MKRARCTPHGAKPLADEMEASAKEGARRVARVPRYDHLREVHGMELARRIISRRVV